MGTEDLPSIRKTADSLLGFNSIAAKYGDLPGRAFIDQQHRIYAVVGNALNFEEWADPETVLLPALYIPRDYGPYGKHQVLSIVPELIEQFRASGGFEAVSQLRFHRGVADDRLWSIPVPAGTELKYVEPGRIWRFLTSEDFLDGHYLWVPSLPGNYVPARVILEKAAAIDAYASKMLDRRGFAREEELLRPVNPASEGGLQFVYRLYDQQDRLLYVGVTGNLKTRMQGHRRDKKWWADVARTVSQCFDTREEAESAEAEAIVCEGPLHNRHKPTAEQRTVLAAKVKNNSGGSIKAAALLAEKDRTIEQLRAQVKDLSARVEENEEFPYFVKDALAYHSDEIPEAIATDIVTRVSNEITRQNNFLLGEDVDLGVIPRASLPQHALATAA